MKRLTLVLLWLWTLGFGMAGAQVAPVKPAPVEPGAADKLTIRECLGVLAGLQALDGRKVIVAQGRPNESVEIIPYSLAGKVRDAISHNIFVLQTVQQEAQAANRRVQVEVGKGSTIAPGSKEVIDLDARMNEYLDRPCKVELDHVRDEDLALDKNDIPPTVLAAIFKIRDRK